MKSKSWPIGITVFYIIFMIGILWMVKIAVSSNFKETNEGYHIQNLSNNDKIQFKKNTEEDGAHLNFSFKNDSIKIIFPIFLKTYSEVKGTLTYFRPSDETLDRTLTLVLNDKGEFQASLHGMKKGFWRTRVSWEIDTKKYYDETSFTIERDL